MLHNSWIKFYFCYYSIWLFLCNAPVFLSRNQGHHRNCLIMKRKFQQGLSTIPSISTKWAITSHINSLNTKKGEIKYDIGNAGSGSPPSWLLELQWKYMYKQIIKTCTDSTQKDHKLLQHKHGQCQSMLVVN
jgi:hypothetical protein